MMLIKALQAVIYATDSLLLACFCTLPFGTVLVCVATLLLSPKIIIELAAR